MKSVKMTLIILITLLCAFFLVSQETQDKKKDRAAIDQLREMNSLKSLKNLSFQIKHLDQLKALKNLTFDIKGLDCLKNLDIRLEGLNDLKNLDIKLDGLDALNNIDFSIRGLEALDQLDDLRFDIDLPDFKILGKEISEKIMKNLDEIFEAMDFSDWDLEFEAI